MNEDEPLIEGIHFKKMKKNIDKMNLDNLTMVYSILRKNNESITKKKDGYLVNLGQLSNTSINQISKFIDFTTNSIELLEKDETIKNKYLDEMNKLIKEHTKQQNNQ